MKPPDDDTLDAAYGETLERHRDAAAFGRSASQQEFARQRFREGVKTRRYLEASHGDVLKPGAIVVDVGCGSSGFLLAFSATGRYRCAGIETDPRPEAAFLNSATGIALRVLAAKGEALPFGPAAADLVLLVETLEHLPEPAAVGAEVSRILRPGGLCFLTTPPRLRHLFARDPHYGIPGLLALPEVLQSLLFRRLRPGAAYEVAHTFWTSWGVARQFPGLEVAEIVSKNWAGPLRRLDWDWIILRRTALDSGAAAGRRDGGGV